MQFKTIILDFDGTIIESVGIKDKAFEIMYRNYPEHINKIMEYHLSNNATVRFDKFKYITEKILNKKYTGELERNLSKRFKELVFNNIVECPYVNGAEEFLSHFYGRIPLYLASASPADELDEILVARNLKKYFKKVYAFPWIKQNILRNILSEEAITTNEALFIGDTFEDYQAAKDVGIFFIGRDSKRQFYHADVDIYPDLNAIKNVIQDLMRD